MPLGSLRPLWSHVVKSVFMTMREAAFLSFSIDICSKGTSVLTMTLRLAFSCVPHCPEYPWEKTIHWGCRLETMLFLYALAEWLLTALNKVGEEKHSQSGRWWWQWLILIVNLTGSSITMVIHFWACLRWSFYISLIAWGEKTYTEFGFHHPPRQDPRLNGRNKMSLSISPGLLWLWCNKQPHVETMWPRASSSRWHDFPSMMACILQELWAETKPSSIKLLLVW